MAHVMPRAGILEIKPYMLDAAASGMNMRPPIYVDNNENALGASPLAIAAAREAAESIERYPENGPERLAKKLARCFRSIRPGLSADMVQTIFWRGLLRPICRLETS